MGAGLSQKQISSRVRNRLHAVVREYGGEYIPGTKTSPAEARGVTEDGIEWRVSYGVSRSSNGETFGIPAYSIQNGDLQRNFSGLHGDLGTSLDVFRAEQDDLLVFIVAYGGGAGKELDVTEDSLTRDLGQARWAQQQTGNRANLWVAHLDEPEKVTILREFGFTDRVGHEAMRAYMDDNDLDIWNAQSTLETNPVLTVIDARNPTPQPSSSGPGRSM